MFRKGAQVMHPGDGGEALKVWKLVSGILSIVLCCFVMFQSCAAGIADSLGDGTDTGMVAGGIVGILLLAGGVVSIVSRNSQGKGLDITLIVLYGLAALTGYTLYGMYSDLQVWATWCLLCAVFALVSLIKSGKGGKSASSDRER